MSDEQDFNRVVPSSTLDMEMLLTDPVWGDSSVAQELRTKLKSAKFYYKNGTIQSTDESLWGLLSIYTRDLRLGNLSRLDGEYDKAQQYINFAGDLLEAGLRESFMQVMRRCITIVELSQSKGGFLRRRFKTFSKETKEEFNTGKKDWWGKNKVN